MGEYHSPREFKIPAGKGGSPIKKLAALKNWRRRVLTQFGWTLWERIPELIDPETLETLNRVNAQIKELQAEEKKYSKRKMGKK